VANRPRYTAEKVLEAVKDSYGILSVIAERLGCHRDTVVNYAKRYATIQAAIDAERESLIDFAEHKLVEEIRDNNITAIIFTLKTQGKSRGYVERSELSGPNGGPLSWKQFIEGGDGE
jgi:hypothetical protein